MTGGSAAWAREAKMRRTERALKPLNGLHGLIEEKAQEEFLARCGARRNMGSFKAAGAGCRERSCTCVRPVIVENRPADWFISSIRASRVLLGIKVAKGLLHRRSHDTRLVENWISFLPVS